MEKKKKTVNKEHNLLGLWRNKNISIWKQKKNEGKSVRSDYLKN